MSAKLKPKQPYRPFAKWTPKMKEAVPPAERKKERIKHTHFVRHGNDNEKKTIAKPKDWAFRKPVEGRGGKAQRAHKVKLIPRVWTAAHTMNHLLEIKAGTRDCRWTVTLDNPHRPVTAVDVLRILQELNKDASNFVEVEFSDAHRFLHIIEEFASIAKQQNEPEELGEGTQNK